MSETVDVVMVTLNHAATLDVALASLAAQELVPAQIVVSDNGSVDGCATIAEGWSGRLPVNVVRLVENRGFSAAANEGLRRCSSPWVLSLNPDCRLEPNFLSALVGAAARRARAGAASGLLLRGTGPTLAATQVVDSAGMIVSASGRHLDRGTGGPVQTRLSEPAFVFGASGAAALYRRRALEEVAYPGHEVFDERFFAYREDADLAWRLQRRGWACLFWPAARAYHARGLKPETKRQGSEVINRLSVRNRFLLRLANADWRWHLACFPAWLLRDLAVVLACLTVERSSLPGLREAWGLRRLQRLRGRENAARAAVSGWQVARWFLPFGQTRVVTS